MSLLGGYSTASQTEPVCLTHIQTSYETIAVNKPTSHPGLMDYNPVLLVAYIHITTMNTVLINEDFM